MLTNKDFEETARQALSAEKTGDTKKSTNYLVSLFNDIKANPRRLKDVKDFETVGNAFKSLTVYLVEKRPEHIDARRISASVGYFCLSKAIEMNGSKKSLYLDRFQLMATTTNSFEDFVSFSGICRGPSNTTSGMCEPEEATTRMLWSDIKMIPTSSQLSDFLRERIAFVEESVENDPIHYISEYDYLRQEKHSDDWIGRLKDKLFHPMNPEGRIEKKIRDEIVRIGIDNHKLLGKAMERWYIEEGDLSWITVTE